VMGENMASNPNRAKQAVDAAMHLLSDTIMSLTMPMPDEEDWARRLHDALPEECQQCECKHCGRNPKQ
jgi:hypothetical protein